MNKFLFYHHPGIYSKHTENWNANTFQSQYVPVFLKEIQSPDAQTALNHIIQSDQIGSNICLCCFCVDESLCHRSIIAGILRNKGVHVTGTSQDYLQYAI